MAYQEASWLADPFAKLGDRLTLQRDGNSVRWDYEGLSAVVELHDDGALDARFIERPAVDEVSQTLAAPVYRQSSRTYRLTRESCSRMVADVFDFFTGVREPRFTFVGARAVEPIPSHRAPSF